MNKTYPIGQNMYLIGIGFLGFISILSKDFILTRPQPSKEPFINLNPVLAYVSGIALILTAVCVMTHRFRRASLLIIINLILLSLTNGRETYSAKGLISE